MSVGEYPQTVGIGANPENTLMPTTPLQLYAAALEKGIDPDKLGKLLELQERWTADRAREAFFADMVPCQGEMPIVLCQAKNDQTGKTYAAIEDIQKLCKPVWIRHGFSLSFSEEPTTTENHKRTVCTVRHRDGHCEKHYLELPRDGIGGRGNPIAGMNPLQGSVSTMTYAERVLTAQVFNIVLADTDLDGKTAGERMAEEVEQGYREELADLVAKKGGASKAFLSWASEKAKTKVNDLAEIPAHVLPEIVRMLKAQNGGRG